jgi:hypothetical protein
VISGRQSPSIRIISSEFPTGTPATLHVRTGCCRAGPVLPLSKPAARGLTPRAAIGGLHGNGNCGSACPSAGEYPVDR